MRTVIVGFAFLLTSVCAAAQQQASGTNDTSHGATNFIIIPAGGLWRPIGPATQITTWSGPFRNTGGHPAEVYIVFTKPPADASQPVNPLPDNLRTYRILGTDFYYPANAQPQALPAELGYTADGFVNADKLEATFPAVGALFPGGMQSSSCRSGKEIFSLILGKKTDAAYFVFWQAPNHVDDVAYLPAKFLAGSLESILDHMSYYEQGGMVELMRFGALYYYLSRVPLEQTFDGSRPSRRCPETPTATATGITVPKGWAEALHSLPQP